MRRWLASEKLGKESRVNLTPSEAFVGENLAMKTNCMRNTLYHRISKCALKPRDRLCAILAMCNDLAKQ